MLLSLCIIMRDPGEEILSCLSSAVGVQEIVVCDTGSRDGSPARVKKWLRKWQEGGVGRRGLLCHYKWRDDFAAARNFALAKATGDWVLWLDSDEELAGDSAGNLRLLAEFLSRGQLPRGSLVRGAGIGQLPHILELWRVNVDEAGHRLEDYPEDLAVRLMQRLPGLAWHGQVHEQLLFEDGRELATAALPREFLHIVHRGYAPERAAGKDRRNAAILLREKEQGGETYLLDYYLAGHFLKEGNWREATRHARAAMAGHRPVHDDFAPWRLLYQARAGEARSLREKHNVPGAEGTFPAGNSHGENMVRLAEKRVEEALEEGIGAFPLYPDFYYFRGGRRWNREEKIKALEDINLALACHREFAGRFVGQEDHFLEVLPACEAARAQMAEEIMEEKEPPFLSACVIMRDSQEDIALCLESLQEADEMIVVDTGSVDRSVEIAKQFTDKVYYFEWVDDFAAAKNFALSKARGEWIAFLDSDEYFAHKGRGVKRLCLDYTLSGVQVLSIKFQNVDLQGRAFAPMASVQRLFRRGAAYRGRLHEHLAGPGGEKLAEVHLSAETCLIYHRGYAPERMPQKINRNKEMLAKSAAGEVSSPHAYRAAIMLSEGDCRGAREESLLSIEEREWEKQGSFRFEAYRYCYRACQALGDEEGKAEVIRLMERDMPLMPDTWALRGMALWNEGREEEGAPYLFRALELISSFEENMPGEVNELAADAPGIAAALREHYQSRGNREGLEKLARLEGKE